MRRSWPPPAASSLKFRLALGSRSASSWRHRRAVAQFRGAGQCALNSELKIALQLIMCQSNIASPVVCVFAAIPKACVGGCPIGSTPLDGLDRQLIGLHLRRVLLRNPDEAEAEFAELRLKSQRFEPSKH